MSIFSSYPAVPEGATARVTQTEIARVAGVHNTTVSLALRNSPAIPEGTRKRIQALAEQMGYHPDPALRALVAYRRGRVMSDRRETIAYITNSATRWGWRDTPTDESFYTGAARKAAQCGYQLEHFWLGEPEMSQRRLSSMLYHRGIKGVLLASHRAASDELLDFDWARVSAVKIGCFPHAPALHRVANDPGAIVRLAMKRVLTAGYHRIGLILPKAWDDATDQAWSSGFLIEQNRLPLTCRVPIFFHPSSARGDSSDREKGRAVEASKLANWFDEFQPEAILSSWSELGGALAECGVTVSGEMGMVDLSLSTPDGRLAGIRQNCESVGGVATEMLVRLMQQNIGGEPAVPTATLVEGVWCDGASLPSLRSKRGWPDGARSFAEDARYEPVA